jgi:hypothetical protein
MTFQEAVEQAPAELQQAFRPGKQALQGQHRDQITCSDARRFTGSIDLDSALSRSEIHGSANRWDYGLGFRQGAGESAIWIEVHPVSTGEVGTVLRKLSWLRTWLRDEAPSLFALTKHNQAGKPFVWLATGSVHLRPGSREARILNEAGLDLPRRKLELR